MAGKVPQPFAGEGSTITFVLPFINRDATESWTKSPVLHPNHKEPAQNVTESFCRRENLIVVEAWNIARFPDSDFPPKNFAQSRVSRDSGSWLGKVRPPREVNKENSRKCEDMKGQDRPPLQLVKALANVQKEQWPQVLKTGRKYQRACVVTRASLEPYLEVIRKEPLEGYSDYDDDRAFLNSQQNVPKEKMLEAKSQIFGSSPERDRSSQRSRSPSAAGPASAPPQPKAMPSVDPSSGVQYYKLSDTTSSKSSTGSSREATTKWADMAPSLVGGADDRLEDLADLTAKIEASTLSDAPPPIPPPARPPSSVASAESEWELMPKERKRKGAMSEANSKASRVSSNVNRAAAFLKQPPPATS